MGRYMTCAGEQRIRPESRCSGVAVVEAADAGEGDDVPVLGWLDLASSRRVSGKRHVRPVLIEELRVLANEAQEMAFAEHDHVVGELASGRGGRPLDFGMYLATVFLSTRKPSFASSIVIRRRLHVGFPFAIRTISFAISGATGGRPTRLDFQAQKLFTTTASASATAQAGPLTIPRRSCTRVPAVARPFT